MEKAAAGVLKACARVWGAGGEKTEGEENRAAAKKTKKSVLAGTHGKKREKSALAGWQIACFAAAADFAAVCKLIGQAFYFGKRRIAVLGGLCW